MDFVAWSSWVMKSIKTTLQDSGWVWMENTARCSTAITQNAILGYQRKRGELNSRAVGLQYIHRNDQPCCDQRECPSWHPSSSHQIWQVSLSEFSFTQLMYWNNSRGFKKSLWDHLCFNTYHVSYHIETFVLIISHIKSTDICIKMLLGSILTHSLYAAFCALCVHPVTSK